jgi:hypothetical protein
MDNISGGSSGMFSCHRVMRRDRTKEKQVRWVKVLMRKMESLKRNSQHSCGIEMQVGNLGPEMSSDQNMEVCVVMMEQGNGN